MIFFYFLNQSDHMDFKITTIKVDQPRSVTLSKICMLERPKIFKIIWWVLQIKSNHFKTKTATFAQI
jgi:hypothetical protein